MALRDFVKVIKKSALLAHLKGVDEATAKWRKDLLDAVVTKDELVLQMGTYTSHDELADRELDEQHPATAIELDVTGFGGNLSAADTDVQLALDTLDDLSTNDENAIHDDVSGEIAAVAAKTAIAEADYFLIEDSEASNAKKSVTLDDIGTSLTTHGYGGIDENAIHDNVSDEIHQIATKTPAVLEDEFVLEDSESTWDKKRLALGDIPVGEPGWQIEIDFETSEGYVEDSPIIGVNEYLYYSGPFVDGRITDYNPGPGYTPNASVAVPTMDLVSPYVGGVLRDPEGACVFHTPGIYATAVNEIELYRRAVAIDGVLDVYFRAHSVTGQVGLGLDDNFSEEHYLTYFDNIHGFVPPGYPDYRGFRIYFGINDSGKNVTSVDWEDVYTYGETPVDIDENYIHSSNDGTTAYYYHLRLDFTNQTLETNVWDGDLEDEPGVFQYTYNIPYNTINLLESSLRIVLYGDWNNSEEAYLFNVYVYYDMALSDNVNLGNIFSLLAQNISHSDLQNLELDDHEQYILRSEVAQNGFLTKNEDVSLSLSALGVFKIEPETETYVYYVDGIRYRTSDAKTIDVSTAEGLWAIYFDGETLSALNNPSSDDIDNIIERYCIIAYVYWDDTNSVGKVLQECHGCFMSPATHHWIHDNIGSVYKSGMAVGDIATDEDGSLDAHAQFGVALGSFYDEDLQHSLVAVLSTTGLEVWYLDGSNWRWDTNAGFSILTTGTGRMAWNSAGSQAEVTNNQFALCHVFATNIIGNGSSTPQYIAVQGQNEYNTIASARNGANTEINSLVYGSLPLQEVVPVATIIFQTSDSYSNAVKSRTRTTDTGADYIDWRYGNFKASVGSPASDHGSLYGLADDDHTQYLLADGTRGLSADWDAGTFEIRANTFESDVEIGTAPFTVASTTVVTNLNADLLDGEEASAFADAVHTHVEADIIDLNHTDATAIHDNVAGEINAISAKAAPVDADIVIIEDSEDTWNKKKVALSDLPGGVGASTFLGLTDTPADYTDDGGKFVAVNVGEDALEFVAAPAGVTDHGALSGLEDDDHSQYLLAAGTRSLSADWDAGSYEIRAQTFESDVADGTAPLTIASNTMVENLNVELFHGLNLYGMPSLQAGQFLTYYEDPEETYNITGSVYNSDSFLPTSALDSQSITMTVYNNTGSQIDALKVCYISGDSSGTPLITLADADAESTASKMLVIVQENITSGKGGQAYVYGWISGFSSLTPGAIQYLSTSVGGITETAPSGEGDIVRILGYAMSATEIFFNPDKTYIELA